MKNKNTFLIASIALLAGFSANAQEGFGTNTPSPSSVVDMVASNKGVLMPRVALTNIEDTVTVPAPANALTVFNTATSGTIPNNVTPGYYYWNTATNRWIRLLNENDAVEPWLVQGTGAKATSNTQDIYQMGNVAIGANTIPTILDGATTIHPRMHIEGDVSTTGKLWTVNSVYADYVFEKYFAGKSVLNPQYEFKSLEEVKAFIKTNHHLPGVTPITDLQKQDKGYTFDMTQLTIQSLEKIEELYLHTLEQKDRIEAQQAIIERLEKEAVLTAERFLLLEQMILKGQK